MILRFAPGVLATGSWLLVGWGPETALATAVAPARNYVVDRNQLLKAHECEVIIRCFKKSHSTRIPLLDMMCM